MHSAVWRLQCEDGSVEIAVDVAELALLRVQCGECSLVSAVWTLCIESAVLRVHCGECSIESAVLRVQY